MGKRGKESLEVLKCIYVESKDAFLDTWRHKQSLNTSFQVYVSVYALFLGVGMLKTDYVFDFIFKNMLKRQPLIYVFWGSYAFSLYCLARGILKAIKALRMRDSYQTFPSGEMVEKLSGVDEQLYFRSLTKYFFESQAQNTKLNQEKAGILKRVHEYLEGFVVAAMISGIVVLIFKTVGV